MLPISALLGFCLAVIPLVITPGASFTLVSARGLAGDRPGAWSIIAGTAAGIGTHALLAGAGLAAVVMQSAELYQVLRLAGAVYLIGLGIVLLRSRRRSPAAEPGPMMRRPLPRPVLVRRAYAANVLNVKAASVYLTLAPQFIPAQSIGIRAMLLVALVHIMVMAVWLGVWSVGLAAVAARFDAAGWRRRIDVLGGAVLVFLGVRTAADLR